MEEQRVDRHKETQTHLRDRQTETEEEREEEDTEKNIQKLDILREVR